MKEEKGVFCSRLAANDVEGKSEFAVPTANLNYRSTSANEGIRPAESRARRQSKVDVLLQHSDSIFALDFSASIFRSDKLIGEEPAY